MHILNYLIFVLTFFTYFKDRTCDGVVCDVENSDCVVPANPLLPPTCKCIEGYAGDGRVGPCNIIPSKLKVRCLKYWKNYTFQLNNIIHIKRIVI